MEGFWLTLVRPLMLLIDLATKTPGFTIMAEGAVSGDKPAIRVLVGRKGSGKVEDARFALFLAREGRSQHYRYRFDPAKERVLVAIGKPKEWTTAWGGDRFLKRIPFEQDQTHPLVVPVEEKWFGGDGPVFFNVSVTGSNARRKDALFLVIDRWTVRQLKKREMRLRRQFANIRKRLRMAGMEDPLRDHVN